MIDRLVNQFQGPYSMSGTRDSIVNKTYGPKPQFVLTQSVMRDRGTVKWTIK